MRSEELLAGPRGRTLLLGLALGESDCQLWEVAHLLEQGEDPSRLQDRIALVVDRIAHGAEELTRERARGALADVVTIARYWQEPPGEELLASLPVVVAALGPLADALCREPNVQWWNEPVAPQQWWVQFDQASCPGEVDLVAERLEVLTAEAEAASRPRDPRAPWSGQWWSCPSPRVPGTTGMMGDAGPAGLWFVEDDFGWEEAWVHRVEVPDDVRVFEVQQPADWAELCCEFPLEVTAQKRHDWYRVTGRDGTWLMPDWAAVGDAWDGVHVSASGYLTTAGRCLPVVPGAASVMAGWNPDETRWLTGRVRVIGEPTRWILDDEGWRPGV